MSDEIFAQGEVRITKTIALIGGTSYPINGITAVFVVQEKLKMGQLLGGLFLLIMGLGLIQSSTVPGIFCLLIGAGLVFAAFQRPFYLMLKTAAGDTQALSDKNNEFIASVRAAIETAVSQRG